MPSRLTPEEKHRRLELYNRGLKDVDIAASLGKSATCVCRWRQARGLPVNSAPINHTRPLPLPPDQREEMRTFLLSLTVWAERIPRGQKIDVGWFMAEWRKM